MRNRFKIIGVLLSLFVLSLVFGFLIQAWTGPTSAPPGANLPRPINVGDDDQEKAGRISATEFYDVDDPDYYINPSGASKVSGSVSIGGNLVDLTNSKTIYDASTGKISPLVMPYQKGDITSDWATNDYTAGYYDVSNLTLSNVKKGTSFGRAYIGTGTYEPAVPACPSSWGSKGEAWVWACASETRGTPRLHYCCHCEYLTDCTCTMLSNENDGTGSYLQTSSIPSYGTKDGYSAASYFFAKIGSYASLDEVHVCIDY